MSESFKILQWNCRGIGANLTDLQLLLSQNVHVACLQETGLQPNSQFSNITQHTTITLIFLTIPRQLLEAFQSEFTPQYLIPPYNSIHLYKLMQLEFL